MASANFLEEALSTDVDESAVSAIVGSLENQLVTSTSTASGQTNLVPGINQNHINSAISNGGTASSQKHGTIANGESVNVVTTAETNKLLANNVLPGTIITGAAAQAATGAVQNQTAVGNFINQSTVSSVAQSTKPNDAVKIVYSQAGQAMTSTGAILTNRVTFPPQSVPNGTIGLTTINPQTTQTVLQTNTTNVQTIQAKQPTLVIKTSGAPTGAPGLVTVPMNVTASVPQINNVGTPSSQSSTTVLSNLQVVNVRSGVTAQPQKGQAARVVLSTPQMVGARPGAPVSCCTLVEWEGCRQFNQNSIRFVTNAL